MGKADGSVVTDADLGVQRELTHLLAERWPSIALLGEEMSTEEQASVLNLDHFWCLDPVDGTSNFASGLPYFAISLALIEKGEVTSGIVYDPIRKECFRADRGQGAWLNDQPLKLEDTDLPLARCLAMVDLKRLPSKIAQQLVINPPYRSQRNFGAIALEWCWMAEGRTQLYLHGGQKLWDYVAGKLIFQEAKGAAYQHQAHTALSLDTIPAVAATNDRLLCQWVDWLQSAGYAI